MRATKETTCPFVKLESDKVIIVKIGGWSSLEAYFKQQHTKKESTMKKMSFFIGIVTIMMFSVSMMFSPQTAVGAEEKKLILKEAPALKKPVEKIKIKPGMMQAIRPCPGPDPAVIKLNIVKSATANKGILNITTIVKNIGLQDFVSGSGQQSVRIQAYNKAVSGPSAYEQLAKRDFTRLNKGASLTTTARHELNFFIEWGHRTAHTGECQCERDIIAAISLDPDIYMDANKQNDDCNQGNNTKRQTIKYMCQCPW